MANLKNPYGVLIVTGTDKGASVISDMLDRSFFYPVTTALSGAEARRMLMRADYDLVIINAPLPDEFGHDLASFIAEKYFSSVIIMVKGQMFDNISSKVEEYGIFTIAKPVDRHSFHQLCMLVRANAKKFELFRKENDRLKSKLEELKLVSQAKCLLVEYQKMTESQAHRYIEKQAMDLRTTKSAVAEEIIKSYEIQ